jgi:formylglycine-generating enzyme required for sulfatase activity
VRFFIRKTRWCLGIGLYFALALTWAEQSYQDCPSCPEMVVLPAGTVLMGTLNLEAKAAAARAERETSTQRIASFAIGRFEITQAQWQAYVADEPIEERRLCYQWISQAERFDEVDVSQDAALDVPARCVSFNEVQGYLQWLSRKTGKVYRLPSEAEWEYAAKAGALTTFPWGDDPNDACDYGNVYDLSSQEFHSMGYRTFNCRDGYPAVAPVGTFHANAFGLFDMIGNVAEWTADCYTESYVGRPTDGRAWVWSGGCGAHVVKGGGYFSPPELTRPGARWAVRNRERYEVVGFRVASDTLTRSDKPPADAAKH